MWSFGLVMSLICSENAHFLVLLTERENIELFDTDRN